MYLGSILVIPCGSERPNRSDPLAQSQKRAQGTAVGAPIAQIKKLSKSNQIEQTAVISSQDNSNQIRLEYGKFL